MQGARGLGQVLPWSSHFEGVPRQHRNSGSPSIAPCPTSSTPVTSTGNQGTVQSSSPEETFQSQTQEGERWGVGQGPPEGWEPPAWAAWMLGVRLGAVDPQGCPSATKPLPGKRPPPGVHPQATLSGQGSPMAGGLAATSQ